MNLRTSYLSFSTFSQHVRHYHDENDKTDESSFLSRLTSSCPRWSQQSGPARTCHYYYLDYSKKIVPKPNLGSISFAEHVTLDPWPILIITSDFQPHHASHSLCLIIVLDDSRTSTHQFDQHSSWAGRGMTILCGHISST
jgi:hypothetical protein